MTGAKRKSTLRTELKATSQEEKLQNWKEHFKNWLRNAPKISDVLTKKNIYSQQDIKLG